MPDCALPPHLKNWKNTGKPKLHNDWPWPFKGISRGWNAFGPRCPESSPGYISTPPKNFFSFNATRWMTDLDVSDAFIESFRERFIFGRPAPKSILILEMRGGAQREGRQFPITGDEFKMYGPSPLQKFSRFSIVITKPWHISIAWILKKREKPGSPKSVTGPDTVFLFRLGYRWDSFDKYYNVGFYLGLRWN